MKTCDCDIFLEGRMDEAIRSGASPEQAKRIGDSSYRPRRDQVRKIPECIVASSYSVKRVFEHVIGCPKENDVAAIWFAFWNHGMSMRGGISMTMRRAMKSAATKIKNEEVNTFLTADKVLTS